MGDLKSGVFKSSAATSMGSIGLALKWIGLLSYLRAFPRFSKTLRMIHQITIDIVPYVLVYSVLIMSLCVFVFVNIPWSELLLEAPNISAGFLNVLLMGLTTGVLADVERGVFTNPIAALGLLLFASFGILIMLNLLIAVMGACAAHPPCLALALPQWHFLEDDSALACWI
eukprot:COSAG06_NODE_3408_length_5387_cov_1.505295_2_plen_171_part_00